MQDLATGGDPGQSRRAASAVGIGLCRSPSSRLVMEKIRENAHGGFDMGGLSGSVLDSLAAQIEVVLCARDVSAALKARAGGEPVSQPGDLSLARRSPGALA